MILHSEEYGEMGIQFTPDLAEKVKMGTKTQTRRRLKPGDLLHFSQYGWGHDGDNVPVITDGYCEVVTALGRTRWKTGESYAIQPGRGKQAICRAWVIGIRMEQVGSISEEDARAEGFADRAGFFSKWRELYGADVDFSEACWVLDLKVDGDIEPVQEWTL